jgi:CDGSH-type Zn-finger protein
MARLVRLTMTTPVRIDASALPKDGKPLSICTCGISKKFPFCDGAHKLARSEEPGKLYTYNADGTAVIKIEDDPQYVPPQPEPADGDTAPGGLA